MFLSKGIISLFIAILCLPLFGFKPSRSGKHQHHSHGSRISPGLESIIPAEIKNDYFYWSIYDLASTEDVKTILEIGSSNGEGSTEAFVTGINNNPNQPTLFCMEVSKERFAILKSHYSNNLSVICYNVSSVPVESFPSEEEVIDFYNNVPTSLTNIPLDVVLSWLKRDIAYVKKSGVCQNGIEIIKAEHNLEDFDMVLIDGSEFLGKPELELVYGARFILLDDIRAYKNYDNYTRLLADPNYELLKEDRQLRNGFAIFKKVEKV